MYVAKQLKMFQNNFGAAQPSLSLVKPPPRSRACDCSKGFAEVTLVCESGHLSCYRDVFLAKKQLLGKSYPSLHEPLVR